MNTKTSFKKNKILTSFFIAPIKVYQIFISPYLPRACKYEVSCSRYAINVIKKYGIIRGLYLATRRIISCR